jgi:hypothetical protein
MVNSMAFLVHFHKLANGAVLNLPYLTVQFGAWLGVVLWPPIVMYYGTAPIHHST